MNSAGSPMPTAVTDALAVLVSKGLVDYRGSRKTGGYYAKELGIGKACLFVLK